MFGDNRKRLEIAKKMGVDHAIHIEDIADPVEEVKKLTGGRGVDYAIEAVGSVKTYEQAFAMLRRGGKLTACVTVKLRYSDFNTYSKQLRIPYTSADHKLIPKVLDLFERLYQRFFELNGRP